MADETYEIRVAPAGRRQLRKLPDDVKERVIKSLRRVATRAESGAGERGGKSVKKLQGRGDRFFRLRVGDYRVMYDLLEEERVLLVLGVVHRRDLDRWLRGQ